jgi:hypothetical protein
MRRTKTKPVLLSLSLRYWNISPARRQVRICSSFVCVPLRRSDALIVRVCSARVNRSACESRRKTGEKLFAEDGKMLLQKKRERAARDAKQTQDESLAEHQGRGATIVGRGISARECWRNSRPNAGSLCCESRTLRGSKRKRRSPGQGLDRAGHARSGAGGRSRRKNRLLRRIRLRGPGSARARLANHQIPHRQHFQAAHGCRTHAPIQKYVPSFPKKGSVITVKMVAGHLGGIRHYQGDEFVIQKHYANVTEGLASFKDDPLVSPPGTKFNYSSYGFNLLSAAIESASGQDFLSICRQTCSRRLAWSTPRRT